MKILIADDNPDSRMLLKRTLENEGHEIIETINGQTALEMSRREQPDMIISDVLMPGMDGFRFCKEVKTDENLKKIPFIFYTASYTAPDDERLALSMGASRYIVKPVEIERFLLVIKDVFREHQEKKLPIPEQPQADEAELTGMYEKSLVRMLDEKVRELQLFKEIFINSNDAIIVLEPDGSFRMQNSACRAMTGFSAGELKDRTPAAFLGAEVFDNIMKKLSFSGVFRGELISYTKEGRAFYVDLSMFPITDERGSISAYVGILRDTSSRKKSEQEIKKQVDTLRIINSVIRDVSSSLDIDTVMHKIVRSAADLVNGDAASIGIFDPERNIVKYPYHFNMPDEFRNVEEPANKCLAGYVIETRKSMIVNDYPSHPNALPRFVEAGLKEVISVPLISKGKTFGCLGVFGINMPKHFTAQDLDLLESIGQQAAIAIENANLFKDLEQLFINTLKSLATIMDAKSPWTRGHAERVTDYAVAIGKKLGLDEETLQTLKLGGLLHDIGKIGTYDVVLDKPDRLTREEYEIVKSHPERGAMILEPIKQLKDIVPIVRHHHERIDGTGYPDGLKGDEIPLLARILSVADAYDSITADRPYRKSPRLDYALSELRNNAGTQFDPKVVEALLEVISQ
jgi:PAS domain S-box-containing protein/putative nucleotidyltransferase with HDIG domain